MNITMMCPFYYPNLIGGAEVSIKLLAEWLASNGFIVQVVCFDGKRDSEIINKVEVKRYPVIANRCLPLPMIANKGLTITLMYSTLKAMRKFEEKTDVYHVYNVYQTMAAGLYKILGGKKPVVATLNNYAGFCPVVTGTCSACNEFQARRKCLFEQTSLLEKPIALAYAAIYPLLTRLAKRIDRYIALSNNVLKLYTRYNFNPDKIVVVPNFIDIENKNNDRTKSTSDNNIFNILYVGAISKRKGVDILIHAFKMIDSVKFNVRLTLVGSGELISYCKFLAKKLQIEDKVAFLDKVEHSKLEEFYSNADVFVHPARSNEPFGRTLLEALMHDVPCIASDTVSPEIIGDAGMYFKHEDPEDLAKKLTLFINDKDLQGRLRRSCDKVLRRYEIDLVARRITNVYSELVKNSG
ncbi:MAG: glycosyltransferase family 4 protein [Nitrososphaerales archaeon]